MHLDPKVATIEMYLDRHFTRAQIRSVPALPDTGGDAHTFTIESDDERHVLAVCRDFLESYHGSMWEYLAAHDVAGTLRDAGPMRLVVTRSGLRRHCHDVTGAASSHTRRAAVTHPTPLTQDDKERFLECLARYGNVSWAAEQVGKTRACLYAHRKRDSEFADAWNAIARKSTGRYNRVSMERGYRVIDIRSGAVVRDKSNPKAAVA